jgi:hypothetical protein
MWVVIVEVGETWPSHEGSGHLPRWIDATSKIIAIFTFILG